MTNTGIARFYPHPFVSVMITIGLAVLLLTEPSLFNQPDVAWHISAGDWIRAHHAVPATDMWSYTTNGAPWRNTAWGWDIILSVVLQYFGERALFNISQLLVAGTLGLLCYSLLSRKTMHDGAILVTIILVGLMLMGFSAGRPQSATHVFIILYAMILHNSRTTNRYGSLLWLPFLMLLWANMHGGFVAGFIIIGAYGLEALVRKNWVWLKRLVIISIPCGIAIFINPIGWQILLTIAGSTDSVMNNYLLEWAPFQYGLYLARTVYLVVFIIVSMAPNRSVPLADKLLSVVWLLFALRSDRHFPLFIILSAPYAATYMSYFFEAAKIPNISQSLTKLHQRLGMLILGAVVTIILFLPVTQEKLKINEHSFVDPIRVPLDAIEYIQRNYPGKRFYNDYNMGGILIYYIGNTNQIFVDGRAQSAYPEEVMKETVSFLNMDENWYKPFEKYHVDGLILYNTDKFYALYKRGMFRNDWDMAFEGRIASVYMRKQK